MRTSHSLLGFAAALFAGVAISAPVTGPISANASPVYTAGSQYTATLTQTGSQWRLQPIEGQDIAINTGTCATGAKVAPGLWLVVRDARGGLELVAPSATILPPGRPDHVALRACDQAIGRDLAVPQIVLDLLARNTGAVLVQD